MVDTVVTALTTQVTDSFDTIGPFVALVLGAIVTYRLLKRFLG